MNLQGIHTRKSHEKEVREGLAFRWAAPAESIGSVR